MFLQTSRKAKAFGLICAAKGHDAGDLGSGVRKRAGLVKYYSVRICSGLEKFSALDSDITLAGFAYR